MILFFLINDLYFLISAVTAQILNPSAELVIPTGTPNNEANAEIETSTGSRNGKEKMLRVI